MLGDQPQPPQVVLVHDLDDFIHLVRIVGKEVVRTDAGYFECYKIEWIFYLNNKVIDNAIQYDYISSKGLIKSLNIIKNVPLTVFDTPLPRKIGTVDLHSEILVTNVNF